MGNLIGNRCHTCNDELPNNIVLNECFDCSMKNYKNYKKNTTYTNYLKNISNIFRKK
jgi:hypothetical protein